MSKNDTNTDADDTFNGTISYEAHGNLYLNITNRCSASCTFCLRNNADGVYGYNLRLSRDPTKEEIIKELESVDLSKYKEIVFTGFGEPTCKLKTVIKITRWLHERNCRIRLDTNGHAQLMFPEMDVVKELKNAGLESVSVSLNAESKEKYANEVISIENEIRDIGINPTDYWYNFGFVLVVFLIRMVGSSFWFFSALFSFSRLAVGSEV